MKKQQKQLNEDKKKKRKILLACLIPLGAAVAATAITVPLVLNAKKNNGKVYTKVTEEEWKAAFEKIDYMNNEESNFTFDLTETNKDQESGETYSAKTQMFFANKQYKVIRPEKTHFGEIRNKLNFKLNLKEDKYWYQIDTEEPALPTSQFIVALMNEYENATFTSSSGIYSGKITVGTYVDTDYQIGFNEKKEIEKLKLVVVKEELIITYDFTFKNIDSTTIADWPSDQIKDNVITSDLSSGVYTSKTIPTINPDENYIFEFNWKDYGLNKNTFAFISDGDTINKNNISCSKAFMVQPNKVVADDVSKAKWQSDTTMYYSDSSEFQGSTLLYIQFAPKASITANNVKLTLTIEE